MGFDTGMISAMGGLGPPSLLIVGLLGLIFVANKNILKTGVLCLMAGVVVGCFLLWTYFLPRFAERTVLVRSSIEAGDLAKLSLKPVLLSLGKLENEDAGSLKFDPQKVGTPVEVIINLSDLITSYENNLDTVIRFAQNDPDCFRRVSQGVSYARVAGKLEKECPVVALVRTGRYD